MSYLCDGDICSTAMEWAYSDVVLFVDAQRKHASMETLNDTLQPSETYITSTSLSSYAGNCF